ncbi:Rrf2 family transcriptional regulator [Collinsella sp. AGMB00827]|uniref:Rrf2 family transcriptional regulator n=1 Tax=Collinsella ureilytica TaxID=2869515 RepID=A0ABS7MI11_9ACTN|nr:Rrf2 family transcriptional regulator [Collinsella urealyticum]MBY4797006.1 Rrf2 family transcriptional regulator [Collinsella urealyticum]
MLVTSKGRYALRLMIHLAAFAECGVRVSLRSVAEKERISLKYLEQLVRPLQAAGLIRGVRGKGGGYILARPAANITAGEVLRAAEGDAGAVACEGLEGLCARSEMCSTVRFWSGLEEAIEHYVDGFTLADLAHIPNLELGMGPKAAASQSCS